jgi:site-specific DNA-methyltransferase (adenine-specific)
VSAIKAEWLSEDGSVRLILGDCLEVLPTIGPESVDAVVTDPPYANLKGGYERTDDRLGKRINVSVAVGDAWQATFDWAPLAEAVAKFGLVVFCGHQSIVETAQAFAACRRAALLTWHKPNSAPTGKNVPRFTEEYAWCFAKRPGLRWDGFDSTICTQPSLAVGCCRNPERILAANGTAAHPTQKPLAVLSWIVEAIDPVSVADPYMGSGTTGVACVRTGRRFVGIEIERKYYAIAKRRIQAELSRFPLFEPQRQKQAGLFDDPEPATA